MAEFIARLKQRKLVQWALAYVAFAFALIQVLDVVADSYDWPHSAMHVVFGLLALGLVIALVLAWYHGEKGRQRVSGAELLLIALVLAIGGGLLWRFGRSESPSATSRVANATSPDAAQRNPGATPSAIPIAAIPAKSIAVLPFENLSTDKGNAYFADGMQDLILTKLADIGDLKVISRTSTARYASHPDDLKIIAQQLGVATILEGSVQKAGNQVLINVQLIDARGDNHLWAESYQRTLDNIFGVEGEVAEKVADALNAKLTGAEQQAVAAKGTQNPAALDAYLRGRALDNHGLSLSGSERAIDFYQQAVREDPNYAQAWAALTIAMSGSYQNGSDIKRSTPDAIRDAADNALRLQPDTAEGLMAQGAYFYRIRRDYPAARDFYLRALQKQPGNLDVLTDLFFVERRMGLWNESIAHFREAIVRDPRDISILTQGADEIFMNLRRFEKAKDYLMQGLKIAPDNPTTNAVLAGLEQNFGRLDAADVWLAKVPADSNDLYERQYVSRQMRLRRRFAELIERMAPVFRENAGNWNNAEFDSLIAAAWAEHWSGQSDRARDDFMRLARAIDQRGGTGSANQMSLFDWQAPLVYAGLGDWSKADAVSRQAIHLAQGDTLETASATWARAVVLAQHGDTDAAIAMLPGLLAMPAGPTPPLLALDPYWDPIRHDPRFVALTKQPVTEYKMPTHE